MMRSMLVCFVVAGLCLSAFAVETVALPRLPPPAIVDGDLADSCWKEALATGPLTAAKQGLEIIEGTEAWLFHDGESLYVGARCSFRDYALREELMAKTKAPTGFYGDCVEIFLDPGDTGNYAHIGINFMGAVTVGGVGTVKPVKCQVQMHGKDWTLEARIPFDAIKLLADRIEGSGDWRINVCRGNYAIDPPEISSWSKLENGAFHEIASFNRVKGIPADLVAIRRTQKAAERKDFEIAFDRMVYAGDTVAKASLDFLYDRPMKGFRATATVKDDAGRIVAEKTVSPIPFHVDFEFPLASHACGRHTATIAVLDADGKAVRSGERQFWKIPPGKTREGDDRYEIRNGCIYRNGEFHFPIITWCAAPRDYKGREQYRADLDALFKEMSDCGFTATMTSLVNFPEEDEDRLRKVGSFDWITWEHERFRKAKKDGMTFADYCAAARRHGIAIIAQSPYLWRPPTPYSTDCFVDHVIRLRDVSNVMCWHTSDEQDGCVEHNMLLNRLYHEIDPTRFTWINTINGVEANKDAADVLSTDPYPIPGGSITSMASVGDRLERAIDGRTNVCHWTWIQNFGGEGSWTRPPTPEEVKCMVMLSVNHGVKGIAYFTWTWPDLRNGVRQHKDGTRMYPEFNAYLRQWTPILCQGEVKFRGRQGDLDVLAVVFRGRKAFSVVNIGNKPIENAAVRVDGFGETKVSLPGYGTKVIEL